MIDFHSHCLPGVDDGAKDVAMAKAMLEESARQGVDTVVATPHFYYNRMTPEEYFARRSQAYAAIQPVIPAGMRVLLGAEVQVQEGLCRIDLRPFCLAGTDVILLEFPLGKPPVWLNEEIENIIYEQKLIPMFAHVDRYIHWYSRSVIAHTVDFQEAILQISAESLSRGPRYRRLMDWLPPADKILIGSDMHDNEHRPPNMGKAVQFLKRNRHGRVLLDQAELLGRNILAVT